MVERDRYVGGSKPRLNEKLQKTVLKDQKLSANLCRLLGFGNTAPEMSKFC